MLECGNGPFFHLKKKKPILFEIKDDGPNAVFRNAEENKKEILDKITIKDAQEDTRDNNNNEEE